ncbi:hypothetical protein P691DRAFT_805509 [Macrolepiota fuliginosa MF-IS2]|uniref:Uncharacterized protein n=1 Tax=Macrolepiota fuliginosa MF-IS2 TaxID=1400762 RepID=A0A9P5X928_9AGAR|nr:hypothetical protein P691DRAFT_805509 [Macrolepiota fuliginosa MF-IS2]
MDGRLFAWCQLLVLGLKPHVYPIGFGGGSRVRIQDGEHVTIGNSVENRVSVARYLFFPQLEQDAKVHAGSTITITTLIVHMKKISHISEI